MTSKRVLDELRLALDAADEALNDPKKFGSLLSYTNFMFSMGKFYALMQVWEETDEKSYMMLCDAYIARAVRLEEKSDHLYISLKKTIA